MLRLATVSVLLGCEAFAPAAAPRRRTTLSVASAPTVEKIPESSSLKLTVPIQGAVTKAAFTTAARAIAAERAIPGWRPQDAAKIPPQVVAREVGLELIYARAIEKLSETEVHSAIATLGIEAVGQAMLIESPEKLVTGFQPGEVFELAVKVDVWPEAEWPTPWDDGSLEVTVERTAKDESVRVKAMEALRQRYVNKRATAAEYAACEGDVVTVDMRGYERDPATGAERGPLPVDGVGGEGLEITLEQGKFLPGVVEALVGAKAGETRTVNVDFPGEKKYRDNQPLAGCTAGFEITVIEVKTQELPDLDDAFASTIRAGLTLEELEREVENTVGSQEQDQTDDRLHKALEEALASRAACPLPDSVVTESARQKFALMLADMRSQGIPDAQLKEMISPEGFAKYKKVVLPLVERELRGRLAIESIAKNAAIDVDDSLVEEQMELVKRQYEQQSRETSQGGGGPQTFDEGRAREKVTSELLRIKVLDHAKNFVKISYVDAQPAPQPDQATVAAP